MTREHKLALILGFSVLMVVGLLVGDHFSKARKGAGVAANDVTSESQVSGRSVAMAPAPSFPGAPGALPGGVVEPTVAGNTGNTLAPAVPANPGNSLLVNGDQNGAAGGGISTVEPIQMGVLGGRVTEPTGIAAKSTGPIIAFQPDSKPVTSGPSSLTAAQIAEMNDRLSRGEPTNVPSTSPLVLADPGPVTASKKPETAPVSNGLPLSKGREQMHPVEEGETLFSISKKYYGDGGLWKDLAKYNASRVKGDSVREGVTLRIPPKDVLQGKAQLAGNAVGAGGSTPSTGNSSAKPESADSGVKPFRAVEVSGRPSGVPVIGSPSAATSDSKPAKKEVAKSAAGTYTVKAGDTLSKIAASQLGSAKRADEIVKLNSATLEDPDALHVGMVLKLPAK